MTQGPHSGTTAPATADGRHGGPNSGRERGARPSLSAGAVPQSQRQVGSQDAVTYCRQASVSGWGSQRLSEGRTARGGAVRSSSAEPGVCRRLPEATGVFSGEASPADDHDLEATGIVYREGNAATDVQPAAAGVFSSVVIAAEDGGALATGVFSREGSMAADEEVENPGVFSREASTAAIALPLATGVFSREASATDDQDHELLNYKV